MLERVIIAGYGGDGAMLLGKLYATVAADRYPHVTYFPSYGAEVRGGTAHCSLILSDDEIASPLVEQVDAVLLMNQASTERFLGRLTAAGLAVINSSLVHLDGPGNIVRVPATEIANAAGNPKVANMAMLGAYLHHRPLLELSAIKQAMTQWAGPGKQDLLQANMTALDRGYAL